MEDKQKKCFSYVQVKNNFVNFWANKMSKILIFNFLFGDCTLK